MSRARTFADLATASESNSLANRNLIINGAMNVNQRGTQTTIQTGFTLDRWSILSNTAARVTVSQDTNVPTGQGFLNSLKIDVTTADTSVASSDITALLYKFEGQDLQQLRKGTSSAKTLTLQFWVSSPKTGVHTLHFFDMANSRIVATTYTIASADTWQYVNVTFPADTTGALANDNTNQLQFYFGLLAGTNYTSGTLATSWAANTNANRMVGQVNVLDSTDNNFYITGVQMEIGNVATPFEFEKHADTLAKCQRYYHTQSWAISAYGTTSNYPETYLSFPVAMRASPTMTDSTGTGSNLHSDGITFRYNTEDGVACTVRPSSNGMVGAGQSSSPATINADAEL